MAIAQNDMEKQLQQMQQQMQQQEERFQALMKQSQALQETVTLQQKQLAANQKGQTEQKPEALEKPPQVVTQAKVTEQKPAEDAVYNDWNRSLNDMPSAQAQKVIHDKAVKDGAGYGPDFVKAMEAKMQADLKEYQEIKPFDKVVGGFIQNSVSTSAGFNKDGYAGQSTTVQQQLDILPKDTGVLYGNATLNQDKDLGKPSGNVGLNYATPVVTVDGVDAVGIANVNTTVPNSGKVEARDVGYLVGGVLKGHEGKDNVNHTLAYIGNGAGDSHTFLYRPSKEIYNDGENTLTAYAPLTYSVNKVTDENGQSKWKDAFGAKAGLRGDHDLGDGTSFYAQAEGGVDDAFGKTSAGGMLKFGFAWGGPDKKPSTLEQAHAGSVLETHQLPGTVKPQAIAQTESHQTIATTHHENPNYQSITRFSNDEEMHKMQLAYNGADEQGRHKLLNAWANKLAHNMHMGKSDAEETVRDFLNIPPVQVAEKGYEFNHG